MKIQCEKKNEDLKRFLIWCSVFSEERRKSLGLQQLNKEWVEKDNMIVTFLSNNTKIDEIMEMIYRLWQIREIER